MGKVHLPVPRKAPALLPVINGSSDTKSVQVWQAVPKSNSTQPSQGSIMSEMTVEKKHKMQDFQNKTRGKRKAFWLSFAATAGSRFFAGSFSSLPVPSHPLKGNYDSERFHSETLSTWKCWEEFHTTIQELNFNLMIIQTLYPCYFWSLHPLWSAAQKGTQTRTRKWCSS